MSEFVWAPTPDLIAQSVPTAFLRRTGCADYDALVRRADAEPAWSWAEVALVVPMGRTVSPRLRGVVLAFLCMFSRVSSPR